MLRKKYFNVYIIILFCSILFFMNAFFVQAEAESITESIYWSIDNNELRIQATELADGNCFSSRNAIKNENSSWYNNEAKRTITKVSIIEPIAPVNLSDWFNGFSACKEIDLSLLDTTFVTNMSYMFSNCESLTSLDLSHLNTSRVTNMSFLFRNCESLESLELGMLDTGSVTNMESMFYRCAQISSLDVSHLNTENVVNMRHMFYGCRSLKELDVTNFNVENVEFISSMFGSMNALKKISIGESLLPLLSKTSLPYSWYKENSDIEYTEDFPITEAGTYYKKCQIIFYGFDVDIVGTKECFYGETIDSSGIEVPKNSGYAFEKWVTTRNGTIEFDFSKPITGDTDIYSRFHPCQHEYDAWQITRNPTCDLEGSRHRFCEKCGYEQIEAISKLPHQFGAWETGVDPTCEDEGMLGHYHCSICDKNYDALEQEIEDIKISALGHKFDNIIWDWENTTHAYVSLTCSICHKNITQEALMKEEILSFATCVESGAKKITAYLTIQGTTYSDEKIEALPKIEHKYGVWIQEALPSCGYAGAIAHYHCQVCMKNFNEKYEELSSIEIPALGHTYAEEYTIDEEATCEEVGIQSQHCIRCDSCINITAIPAIGHSYKAWEISIHPTCIEKGEEQRVCAHDANHKETREVQPLGHTYSSEWASDYQVHYHLCIRCEEKRDQGSHSFSSWQIEKNPTTKDLGSESHSCHICGYKEIREIPVLPKPMGLSAIAITGIVIGCFFGVAFLVYSIGCVFYIKKKIRGKFFDIIYNPFCKLKKNTLD